MAKEFKLLCLLCLVAASLVSDGAVEATGSNSTAPTAATPNPNATTEGTSNSSTTPATDSATTGGTSNSSTTPATDSATTGGTSNSTLTPATDSATTGGTSNSTLTPATDSATTGGTSNSTLTPAASSASTPPEPTDPCEKSPCGEGSTCEPRADSTYVCLCLTGALYSNESQSCVNAKVFPGDLQISGITYVEAMADKTSKEFLKAAENISNALEKPFAGPDFSGSIVLEIRQRETSRVWSRSGKGVSATVEIFFKASSSITTEKFEEGMKTATNCDGCVLAGAVFSESPLCDNKPCDGETTQCEAKDGAFSCNCLAGYIKTDFSERICIACPSGQKASEDKMQCEDCPFGYSGLNCNESWQLTLVIVGSVLGGLLLITLIVLPVVALKSPKKSSKKSKYEAPGEPYNAPLPVKAPLGNSGIASSQAAPVNGSANAYANAGMPRIPRATTPNNPWDRTNLEMTPTNSRQNLVPAGRNSRLYEDDDDMAPYAQSRPQGSFYGQSRPQNNPYAQSRPQANPYASSQGLSNPYYTHDNGRRFN